MNDRAVSSLSQSGSSKVRRKGYVRDRNEMDNKGDGWLKKTLNDAGVTYVRVVSLHWYTEQLLPCLNRVYNSRHSKHVILLVLRT